VSDRVAGGGASWEVLPGVTWEADAQSSAFESDAASTSSAVSDGAWRTSLSVVKGRMSLSGYVQRTGPDFVSLGAPNATKDRLTTDASLSLAPLSWLSLYGTFDRYRDNLENDPAAVTTRQQVATGGLAFSLPSLTGINLGYAVNAAVGDPRSAQDNETVTASAGLSQTWRGQTAGVTYQSSKFTDRTKKSNDLDTGTLGATLSSALGSRVSSSLGATISRTKDEVDASTQKTTSYSASVNAELVRSRLYVQLWGAVTATEDDDAASRADRRTENANVEFTWQVRPSTALTLGAFRNVQKDAVSPSSDAASNGGNVRVSYSF
jgi:hypothetical protein